LKNLLATNNRLQNIFMREFKQGLTGNQLLENILSSAHEEGIPSPRIFSHSLGLFLHEPGPLIGLPWEQDPIPGRGEVRLEYNSCFMSFRSGTTSGFHARLSRLYGSLKMAASPWMVSRNHSI
jgi:hypothetical protein